MKEFPFLLYKTEKEDISINALIKVDAESNGGIVWNR